MQLSISISLFTREGREESDIFHLYKVWGCNSDAKFIFRNRSNNLYLLRVNLCTEIELLVNHCEITISH